MTTSTSSSQDISNISSLPSRDQRLHALAQTGLVRKFHPDDWWDGLIIRSGQIAPPSPHGWSTLFPFELLTSDNANFTAEVWEIIFSQNRIILQGDLAKSLTFLNDHSSSAKHIKAFDIQFDQEHTIQHWNSGSLPTIWQQICNFIATNLTVDHLDLSLDAGPTHESYIEMGASEEDLDFLPKIYEDIVKLLKEALAGKKPKSLSIYWAAFFHMESEEEKQIMGEHYDSLKLGKIPYTRRSAYFPHGAPRKHLENPDGLQL